MDIIVKKKKRKKNDDFYCVSYISDPEHVILYCKTGTLD
jgi:hypothetical protein